MASSIINADYPQSWGNKRVAVWYHKGPASYTVVTVASPPTGGDPVTDTEAGMRYFDYIDPGCSDNAQYRIEAIPSFGNPSQAQGAGQGGTQGSAQRSWILRWMVVSTGLEVAGGVNLSSRTVRLFGIGVK